jgi:hypothetical protein
MRRVIVGLFLVSVLAPAASAQTGKLFALGGGLSGHKYTGSDFTAYKNPSISVDYRISFSRNPKQGWKWEPKSGFSWFQANTDMAVGGLDTRIGRLRARPFMAGIERAYRNGPMKVGVSIVGGPSFNHFFVSDDARVAYATQLGQNLTSIKPKTSFAVRPELSVWYDLGKWFAVHASFNYILDRPTVETTAGGTTTSDRWKTDHFNFHIGVVVGIF